MAVFHVMDIDWFASLTPRCLPPSRDIGSGRRTDAHLFKGVPLFAGRTLPVPFGVVHTATAAYINGFGFGSHSFMLCLVF
jgi:hypothetical protein